jgi:hypothetical protein
LKQFLDRQIASEHLPLAKTRSLPQEIDKAINGLAAICDPFLAELQ